MALSTIGLSQEINTVFSNGSSAPKSLGGYGGPLIEAANVNNDWGVFLGGKGGVIINQKFAFGGVGKALVSTIEFSGDDLEGHNEAPLSLTSGAGGVFVEYISNLESPIHFSIPVHLMGGGVSIEDATSDGVEIESSGIFVIEPGINLEFNLARNFIPGIHLSYRQVFGSSLVNLSNQDLSGVNIGLVFKFGAF